jgi:hypothetical protein
MNSGRPTRATTAGRVYLDLQKLARSSGKSTDDLFRLYALEGLLERLAISRHSANFVLKGGVLLAAYGTRRATRDIDLQARDMANDIDIVLAAVRGAASLSVDDGLIFFADAAAARAIREEDAYQGVRVSLGCELATAKMSLHVDVNIGDPIWPAPRAITVPGLLGRDITLAGYPLAMVHAEKIVTAIDRGPVSTRWRDFADVYALSSRHSADGRELRRSVERVAGHREVVLRTLADVLHGWTVTAPAGWVVWRRKQQLDEVPREFREVLDGVVAFADPVITKSAVGATWHPEQRAWSPTE